MSTVYALVADFLTYPVLENKIWNIKNVYFWKTQYVQYAQYAFLMRK